MNTTRRMLSIFGFVAVATTALALGSSITFAASNTHTHHHIQLMSSDYFPSLAASNTHTHHHVHVMSSGANSVSTGLNSFGSGTLPP